MNERCAFCGGALGRDGSEVRVICGSRSGRWSQLVFVAFVCTDCRWEGLGDNEESRGRLALDRYVRALARTLRVPRSEAPTVRVRLSLAMTVERK